MFPAFFSFIPCTNQKYRIRIITNFVSVQITHEGRRAVVVMKQNSWRTESTLGLSVLVEKYFIVWSSSSKSPLQINYRNQCEMTWNASFPRILVKVSSEIGQIVPGACAICRAVLKWKVDVKTQKPSSGYSLHYRHGFSPIETVFSDMYELKNTVLF